MKFATENHNRHLDYYIAAILESIVSGYYTNIDIFWFVTRILVFILIAAGVQLNNRKLLNFIPVIFLVLSIDGIRAKWLNLEMEKENKLKSVITRSIEKPNKPTLPDCLSETKWRKVECDKTSKELQLSYSKQIAHYNNYLITQSEKESKVDSNLTLYESLPVLIYSLLISACVGASFFSANKEMIIEPVIKETDIDTLIINRLNKGMSNLAISNELNVDRRKVAQVKKSLFNTRTINVQSMSNVVKFEKRKKA